MIRKVVGVALSIVTVALFLFLIFSIITAMVFFVMIGLIAVIAFKILPKKAKDL